MEKQVACSLARADLYFFSRYMFFARRKFKWLRAPHHAKVCSALEAVFQGKTKRLIINIPPRYSKTELAVVNFIAWSLGKCPDAEFIHTSYSAELATRNTSEAQNVVVNPVYSEIFPNVVLTRTPKNDWATSEGGVVYGVGAGGSVTGYGAGKLKDGFGGAIIIDDPHKADEAKSETVRKGVIDWFQNTLESRKNSPQTPIILIMQRLHEEDLSGFLLAGGNGEKWEHLCLPALQENGSALWPEKHEVGVLKIMERAAPYIFSGQYQQSPSPAEGGTFRPDEIKIVDHKPSGNEIQWVRGWDFAASDASGDYTAGSLLGKMPDGRFCIAGVDRGQLAVHDRDALVKRTAELDGTSVRVGVPQDPGQAGKSLVKYQVSQLAGFSVITGLESGDKVTRAEPFAAQVNVGNVIMVRGDWNKALLDEMRLFPNGKNDDQIDSLSRAFDTLMEGSTGILDFMRSENLQRLAKQAEERKLIEHNGDAGFNSLMEL